MNPMVRWWRRETLFFRLGVMYEFISDAEWLDIHRRGNRDDRLVALVQVFGFCNMLRGMDDAHGRPIGVVFAVLGVMHALLFQKLLLQMRSRRERIDYRKARCRRWPTHRN